MRNGKQHIYTDVHKQERLQFRDQRGLDSKKVSVYYQQAVVSLKLQIYQGILLIQINQTLVIPWILIHLECQAIHQPHSRQHNHHRSHHHSHHHNQYRNQDRLAIILVLKGEFYVTIYLARGVFIVTFFDELTPLLENSGRRMEKAGNVFSS